MSEQWTKQEKIDWTIQRLQNASTPQEQIAMIQNDPSILQHCENPPIYFVLAALEMDGTALRHVNDESIRDNERVVLAAVIQNGYALEYASERLRDDPVVVTAAVSQNGFALWFASQRSRSNRSIVQIAVTKNGNALQFACLELKTDRDLVYLAVKQNGLALAYASETFRSDREIVRAAVSQTAHALHFASREFMNDISMIATATKTYDGMVPMTNLGMELGTALKEVVQFLLKRQPGSAHIKDLSYDDLMTKLERDLYEMVWMVEHMKISKEQCEAILSYSNVDELHKDIVRAKRYRPIFSALIGTTWEDKAKTLALSGFV